MKIISIYPSTSSLTSVSLFWTEVAPPQLIACISPDDTKYLSIYAATVDPVKLDQRSYLEKWRKKTNEKKSLDIGAVGRAARGSFPLFVPRASGTLGGNGLEQTSKRRRRIRVWSRLFEFEGGEHERCGMRVGWLGGCLVRNLHSMGFVSVVVGGGREDYSWC